MNDDGLDYDMMTLTVTRMMMMMTSDKTYFPRKTCKKL